MGLITYTQWDDFLDQHPNSHILQTSTWGDFKSKYGWQPYYIRDGNSGAQILIRKLLLGSSIAYIPKGPIGNKWQKVLNQADELCREKNSIVLYLEPDCWGEEITAYCSQMEGYKQSEISIQPRRTISVSLDGCEKKWMERMKQKTRYNIRLAEKKGVEIKQSDDIEIFNQLIQVTSARDEFGIHEPDYYRLVHEKFFNKKKCQLLIAEYQGTPLAALILFFHGKRAWYFYGASNNKERNRMPTYLLQWEAMRLSAAMGCTVYDLWGIPDEDFEFLEDHFTSRSDGLWGVYRFKRGFGGEIKRSAGVFESVINPALYSVYRIAHKLRVRELG